MLTIALCREADRQCREMTNFARIQQREFCWVEFVPLHDAFGTFYYLKRM